MHNLFPIPVGIKNLGEESRELNKQIIKEIYKLKEIENSKTRSGKNLFQTGADLHTRSDFFNELCGVFFNHMKPYLESVGINDPDINCEIDGLWFNYNNSPHAFHIPHIHGSGKTLFSGVYYPSSGILDGKELSDDQNLNENVNFETKVDIKPGSIVLLDPSFVAKTTVLADFIKRKPYYLQQVCLEPKAGTLLLFPAYLPHYVVPTQKENLERFSLVFSVNKK